MENLFSNLGLAIIENPVLIIALIVFLIVLVLVIALLAGRQVDVKIPVPWLDNPIGINIGSKDVSISADTEENKKLNSGGIVYVNVVGFSLLKHREQEEIVTFIDRVVAELLAYNKQKYPPKENSFYFWYKPGWGESFVFVEPHHNESPSLVTTVAFFYALALLDRLQKEKPSIKLGVTLHSGEGIQYTRSGKVSNISGNSLNTAGRIMAFSDGGHFFVSDSAYKNLGNKLFDNVLKNDCISLLEHLTDVSTYLTWKPVNLFKNNEIFNLTEWKYFDRNRKSHSFYNFSTSVNGQVKVGNLQRPPYWVPIEQRDEKHSIKSPNQRFVKHLIESDEVCIVGLTHENTSKFLRTALKERDGKFWKNIQVVFPSERLIHEIKERDRSFELRKQKWTTGKRDIILFFEAQGQQHFGQWACLECDDYLSFWGNRFMTGDEQVIRIAPLIQGSNLKHMPYLTFYKGMNIYNLLSEAFDVITINSNSIVEWDILGQYKKGEFFYQGLASHSHLSQIHDKCKPVVLIMLYMQEFEQTKSVLQKRTIFNASDKYDSYSNISGHLCIEDITNSETLGNFYKEITGKTRKNNKSTHDDVLEESVLASQIFEKMMGWKPNTKVEDSIWERAALRELNEELKLSIQDKARLSFQQEYYLQDANLYFRIYSLLIARDEFNQIREQQPHASLEIFGLADLQIKHRNNELNRLLQNKFDEIFVPIFRKLDISD